MSEQLSPAALPQVLVNTAEVIDAQDADVTGVVWKLQNSERDLDSNVIALPPGGGIDTHLGPDLDVMIHVLAGSGALSTELDTPIALRPGDLIWLPRRSQRAFRAGAHGLRYLTVHKKRQALVLQPPEPRTRS